MRQLPLDVDLASPAIEIFSPIPPLRTGTADYIAGIMEYINRVMGARKDILIAVDFESFDSLQVIPLELHGYPVVDYRTLGSVPRRGATRFYFAANNSYHTYIHRLISGSASLSEGQIITVVHDGALFMLTRHMYGHPYEEFNADSVRNAMLSQFGRVAEKVFERRLNNDLPVNVEYDIHCLGPALENSHEVWTHSLFALSRLLLENNVSSEILPKLRLAAHPSPSVITMPTGGAIEDKFIIGMFGWVTEPKRIDAILHGLALAFQLLPVSGDDRLVLRVVGRKPHDWNYDPVEVAKSLNIIHVIEFIDYPDKTTFESLQCSCDLIFNLRYPSTGETSGTFATARMAGTPVVTSRYHSFHEIGVLGATITSLPVIERWAIAETIVTGFLRWLKKEAIAPLPREQSLVAPIHKLLLLEVAKRLQVSSMRSI